MLSETDRLESLEKVIDELLERSETEAIVVEGARDVRAMRRLGITRNVRAANVGNSIINLCELLCKEFDSVIIMTDWDRKGGQLARLLRNALEACGARYDDQLRMRIARLTKKEVKDVEGLPSYLEHLRERLKGGVPHSRRRGGAGVGKL